MRTPPLSTLIPYCISVWISAGAAVLIPAQCCHAASALALDGTNDVAVASNTLWPIGGQLQSYTVEAWVYPRVTGGLIAGDDAYDMILASPSSDVIHRIWAGPGSSFSSTRLDYKVGSLVGRWNHVAILFDGVARKYSLAVNGQHPLWSDYTATNFYGSAGQNFSIGGYYSGATASSVFGGDVDEVRISSVVRYPGTNNFTPQKTFQPDAYTVALWHFDDPLTSTNFTDASGNGNHLAGKNGAKIVSVDREEGGESFENHIVSPGSNVRLGVVQSGNTAYQWRLDGTNLFGQTSNVLSLTNVGVGQAGTYSLVRSNASGQVTNSVAVTLFWIGVTPSMTRLFLAGPLETNYRIDYATTLESPTQWKVFTDDLVLRSKPMIVQEPRGSGRRFYRAVLIP